MPDDVRGPLTNQQLQPTKLVLNYKPSEGQAVTKADLYPTDMVYRDIPTAWVPTGWTHWTGKYGPQVEDPQAQYPNAMMPCIDSIFAISVTNDTVNSQFVVPKAGVEAIRLFDAGQGDPGTPVGVWWPLGPGDSTLQQGGAFVFSNNTFVAFGCTVGFELVYRRGGTGTAITDPIVIDTLYQNGAGSYIEMIASALAMQVGIVFQWAGDQAPKFMGNLAFNGDSSQMRGGSLISMSSATNGAARYIPWERQYLIGPRNSYTKAFAQLTLARDINIPYIEENPPPEGNILLQYRLRVFGGRRCGELTPGCPNIVMVGE